MSLGSIAEALASHYRVDRELGAGGMATVYLAHDLKHHRNVAIKVLRPELGQLLGADRFLREIEVVAGLHHPHILPLYDSGEAGGSLYYVMPLVEGESLRAKIDREGQLPIDEALRYAREVADALSYAHARGVVHRDIKPDNIMIESGHAVVADFGIAKAVASAGDATALTGTGMSIGTPTYMSPEQASGDRDIDGRSDLYSLACVLYEMLAGQPPFTGKTVEVMVRQHIMTPPPPISQFRPAVPSSVADSLARALAKSPADRFNPVGQFAEALSRPGTAEAPAAVSHQGSRRGWLAGAIAAVVVMAVGGWYFARRGAGENEAISSIAVLPFDNLGGDSANSSFLLGMHGEIVTQLGKLAELQVASRSATAPYQGSTKQERDIARELGVNNLLTGSVQRAGGQLHVTVALTDAGNGRQLWGESYDRQLTAENLFAIQGEIAREVASALSVRLTDEQAAGLTEAPTKDLAALDLYHRALLLWDGRGLKTQDSTMVVLLEQAIARDSSFVQAWSLLSQAVSWNIRSGNISDTMPAKRALDRVRRLSAGSLEDLVASGYYKYYARAEYQSALADMERARQLIPNSTEISQVIALLLRRLGRYDASVGELRSALARQPQAYELRDDLATTLEFMHRFEEADTEFATLLAQVPSSQVNIVRRVTLLTYGIGDTARAWAFLETSSPVLSAPIASVLRAHQALLRRDYPAFIAAQRQAGLYDFSPEYSNGLNLIASAYARMGDQEQASRWADSLLKYANDELMKLRQGGGIDPFQFGATVELQVALALAIKGDSARAVSLAEAAAAKMPVSRDAIEGSLMQFHLATVYSAAGHQDQAIDVIERLLAVPGQLHRGGLRLNPLYDPLRGNPRFQDLVAGNTP
jgi:serine/threonine protein kinase/tetratricopeptide (TPR) repeat protein